MVILPAIYRRLAPLLIACLSAAHVAAAPSQLGDRGQAAYAEYQAAPPPKAFAIAPGGAWGWLADQASDDIARAAALQSCQDRTRQTCVPYAVNDRIVFDAAAWPRLWGPYKTRKEAQLAPVGRQRGERFFDLAFRDPDGRPLTVADLRGKIVLLHFWGSWCAPCRREMPDLQKLHARIRSSADIALVLLQVREPIAESRAWAARQGIALPLHDSGATGEADDRLRLAGRSMLPDRDIAAMFPTTHVLDKHGVVIFSHVGPVHDWPAYEAFLRDAAARSGR
jgi:thiol-disulfide isomerase/thioredoxin